MRQIVLIVHNVRSCHNVGSLLRTAEGLGVERVYLTGYTPYPYQSHDDRLPHVARKIDSQIHKTALGAEDTINWQHTAAIEPVIQQLKSKGFTIAALEQQPHAISLPTFQPPPQIALIVGREVEGIETIVLTQCDIVIEIPMRGTKESFNVAVATAIALYHLSFAP